MTTEPRRRLFPLSSWQLYLEGAVAIALARLVPIVGDIAAFSDSGRTSNNGRRRYESLKWSFVLQAFSLLELLANALIGTAINLHDATRWRPLTPRGLKDDQLTELRAPRRIGTIRKLQLAPELLATLYHRAARIDWGSPGWDAIQRLRGRRNRLVHVKLADVALVEQRLRHQRRGESGPRLLNLSELAGEMEIPANSVWDGLVGIVWYLQSIDRMPGFARQSTWGSNWLFRRATLTRIQETLDAKWRSRQTRAKAYAAKLVSEWFSAKR